MPIRRDLVPVCKILNLDLGTRVSKEEQLTDWRAVNNKGDAQPCVFLLCPLEVEWLFEEHISRQKGNHLRYSGIIHCLSNMLTGFCSQGLVGRPMLSRGTTCGQLQIQGQVPCSECLLFGRDSLET